MIYEVLLERSVAEEANVRIDAESPAEASEIAKQRAKDGMVAWTRVHEQTQAEVARG